MPTAEQRSISRVVSHEAVFADRLPEPFPETVALLESLTAAK